MFAFIKHFELVCFHVLKFVWELGFLLEGILVCCVELADVVRIGEFYFLDVDLLQDYVVHDQVQWHAMTVDVQIWYSTHGKWFSYRFLLTLQESTMPITNRLDIAQLLKITKFLHFPFVLPHLFPIFLLSLLLQITPKIMINQFDLMLYLYTLFNILFYWRICL